MKTKLFYQMTLFALIIFIGVSCEKKEISNEKPPIEYPSEAEPMVDYELVILEMTPEMREQVMVMPLVDSLKRRDYIYVTLYYRDVLSLCNPNSRDSTLAEFAQNELDILGKSPYILLDSDYVVIDWKWEYFHPLGGNFHDVLYPTNGLGHEHYCTNGYYANADIVNEKYYLLPTKWNELTSFNHIWNLEEGVQISKPKVHYVKVKDIEQYGHYQTKYGVINQRYPDLYYIHYMYKNSNEWYQSYVKDMNMLQSYYVETLNQMIKENDFELWQQ